MAKRQVLVMAAASTILLASCGPATPTPVISATSSVKVVVVTATPPTRPAATKTSVAAPSTVLEYVAKLAPLMEQSMEAEAHFFELMSDPRLDDEYWLADMGLQMFAVKSAHEELAGLGPVPPEMEPFHAKLLAANSDLDSAIDYIATGTDNLDMADLKRAMELMQTSLQKMEEAKALLQECLRPYQ